jgi:hypothetical protein
VGRTLLIANPFTPRNVPTSADSGGCGGFTITRQVIVTMRPRS